MNIPAFVNTLIFLFISLLHFYWAAGGRWSMGAVLPTSLQKDAIFTPGKWATAMVATGLLLFAFISLSSTGIFLFIPEKFSFYGNLIIAAIFLLRAIGDFKYVGLFKKIISTPFAANDTRIFTPLCMMIMLMAGIISYQLYKHL